MGASCERDPHGENLFPLRAGLMGCQMFRLEQGQKGRHDLGNGSHTLLPLIDRVGMLPDDLGEPKP